MDEIKIKEKKTLFDIKPDKQRSEKCKTCKHFDWIEYDTGRKIFYCDIRKSNRTENRKLKIKANRTACDLYVENYVF